MRTVPNDFSQTAFLIARIVIRNAGGTPTVVYEEDLRGQMLGSTGGGAGAGGSQVTFSDAVFRVFDDVDNGKQLSFELDQVSSGTTREVTIQDQSGTMALLESPQTFTETQTINIAQDEPTTITVTDSVNTSINGDYAVGGVHNSRTYWIKNSRWNKLLILEYCRLRMVNLKQFNKYRYSKKLYRWIWSCSYNWYLG